jgi:acetyl-CoA hydrolase
VDLVITEHGVADLRTGYRERVDRLIAVADPVHRADLQAAARRLTWISARTWARSGA